MITSFQILFDPEGRYHYSTELFSCQGFFGKFFPCRLADCLPCAIHCSTPFSACQELFSGIFRKLAVAVRRSFPYEFQSEALALALLGYHNVLRLSSTFFRFSKEIFKNRNRRACVAHYSTDVSACQELFFGNFSCDYRYPLSFKNHNLFWLQTLGKDVETMGNSHFSLICAL